MSGLFSELIQTPGLLQPIFRQAYEIAASDVHRGDSVVLSLNHKTRTLEQNAKMWAMLGDIAKQVEWYGQQLTEDDWKDIFTAALRKEKVVPGLNGGFVVLGRSTSRMSIREMADMIDLMELFGGQHQVKFTAPKWRREAR